MIFSVSMTKMICRSGYIMTYFLLAGWNIYVLYPQGQNMDHDHDLQWRHAGAQQHEGPHSWQAARLHVPWGHQTQYSYSEFRFRESWGKSSQIVEIFLDSLHCGVYLFGNNIYPLRPFKALFISSGCSSSSSKEEKEPSLNDEQW